VTSYGVGASSHVSPAVAKQTEWGSISEPGPVSVGIDQSYTGFGLTAMTYDGFEYHTKVSKAPGTGIARLNSIYEWLVAEFEEMASRGLAIRSVAAESPVRMSHSALISGELWAVVRLACLHTFDDDNARFPLQVAPAMLKKYVTGKGTGVAKNEMLLHTYKKWQVEFNDDNAADSYGLARIASGIGDTAYEKDIIAKLGDPKYRDSPSS